MILFRITLGVVIAAAVAVGVLGFIKVGPGIDTIVEQRNNEKKLKDNEIKEHKKTKATLKSTQDKLDAETKAHNATKDQLKAMTTKAEGLEKDKADLTQRVSKATDDLRAANQELNAWKALQIPVNEVAAVIKERDKMMGDLAVLKKEKDLLIYEYKVLRVKYEKLVGTNEVVVEMRPGLKGKITVVDPKWDFVLLNVGQDDGVLPEGVFLVSRKGKLVGKVRVSSVQPHRSIANMMPGWKLADLMEGDEVVY